MLVMKLASGKKMSVLLKLFLMLCHLVHFSSAGIVRRQAAQFPDGFQYTQPDRNHIQPQASQRSQNQQQQQQQSAQYRFPLLPAAQPQPQTLSINHHHSASNNPQQFRSSVPYQHPIQQPGSSQRNQPSPLELQQLLQQHLLSQYASQRTQPKSQQELLQQLLEQQQKTKQQQQQQQQQVIYNPVIQAPKPAPQNQQVIYVGGSQQPPQKSRTITNSQLPTVPPSALYSGSQGVSFSTSYSGDVIKQGKVVASVPVQAIQKAPASEIEFDKGISAKDKAKEPHSPDDEYVVYYYYYYDDDKNKNLTLSFDDIPNLEQYDQPARAPKALKNNAEKSPVRGTLPIRDDSSNSLSHDNRSVHRGTSLGGESIIREKQQTTDTSPVSNVFRYGSADIPRVPVTPNIAIPVSVAPQTTQSTTQSLSLKLTETEPTVLPVATVSPALDELQNNGINDLSKRVEDINDIETYSQRDAKGEAASEPQEITTMTTTATTTTTTTTTTTPAPTTTEETTTTEEPTTTTEKSRRRYGGRQRPTTSRGSNNFGRSSSRRPSSRSSTTTTTTTTTRAPSSTRRGSLSRFSGGRSRRPSASFTSTRVRSRNEPSTEKDLVADEQGQKPTTPTSTTSTTRRFGSSSRRFTPSSSNNRSPSTTSTTTTQSSRSVRGRSRPTPSASRSPALNVASRSRSRPPFFRGRQREEPPQEDTSVPTTPPIQPPEETDDDVDDNQEVKKNVEEKEDTGIKVDEDDDEDEDATETPPTTTEKSRGGIFRTRPRPTLFNGSRPRPNRLNKLSKKK